MQEKDQNPITLKSTLKSLVSAGNKAAEYDLRTLGRWAARVIAIFAIIWVAYISFHLQAREKKHRFERHEFALAQPLPEDQARKIVNTFKLIQEKSTGTFGYTPINPSDTISATQTKALVLESCRHAGQRHAAGKVNSFELFFETEIFDIEFLRGAQKCRDERIIGILQSKNVN